MIEHDREVLNVAEVANYLRVSETTVWRWCSSGKLPAFRIGRGWRVRRTDLEQYIARAIIDGESSITMDAVREYAR